MSGAGRRGSVQVAAAVAVRGMKKRPAIPRLDGGPQTILLVDDVARTGEFYQEILRLEFKDGDGDRYLEFDPGDGGALLIVKREGSIAPMASVAAAGSPATLTFSITNDAYATWRKWLAKSGVEIAQETKWIHGGRSLYVIDPDGRRVEFKTPPSPKGSPAPADAPAAPTAAPARPVEISAPVPAPAAAPAPAETVKEAMTSGKTAATDTPAAKTAPAAKESTPEAKPATVRSAGAAPPIHGVVETILYTDDLERAVLFYREALGLKPMTGDGHRFQAFDAGSGRVLLLFKRGATLEPVPAPVGMIPPHDGHGPHHLAFAIEAADYDAWCARLRQQGVAIESEAHWERGGRSVYFRDPDRHLVELVTPGIWANY